jgi:hypothetical protein
MVLNESAREGRLLGQNPKEKVLGRPSLWIQFGKDPRTKVFFGRISRRQASDVKLLLIGSERFDSFCSEKLLEKFAALRFTHSSRDFTLMVEGRHLQQVDHTSGSARLLVGASENHSSHPGLHNCPCAHRTRFFRYIQIAFIETPIAYRLRCLGDSEHLCMCSRVFQRFNLVPGSRDYFVTANNQRPDRHLLGCNRAPGKAQGLAHVVGIARKIQYIVH